MPAINHSLIPAPHASCVAVIKQDHECAPLQDIRTEPDIKPKCSFGPHRSLPPRGNPQVAHRPWATSRNSRCQVRLFNRTLQTTILRLHIGHLCPHDRASFSRHRPRLGTSKIREMPPRIPCCPLLPLVAGEGYSLFTSMASWAMKRPSSPSLLMFTMLLRRWSSALMSSTPRSTQNTARESTLFTPATTLASGKLFCCFQTRTVC